MAARWRFDCLPVPRIDARIALCPYPGRGGSLGEDLRRLHAWGAQGLATLVEDHELVSLGLGSLPETLEALGMRWWHLPIRDMTAPGADFETRWRSVGPELHRLLLKGRAIALHCHGGLGRTGTIAARLLIEMGHPPLDAIAMVRAARSGSIETREQEAYLLDFDANGRS